MLLHDGPNAGYFAWSVRLDGKHNAEGPAPDGEEYFAMALFMASARWGDGEGSFNYSGRAREILRHALHQNEMTAGGEPMWEPENTYIRFVPGMKISDPSYHLPHFYELFAKYADPDDADYWKAAAKASRKYLLKACHPETGLAAEYANDEGEPLPPKYHGTFFSDSYRVAANIGLDALWFGGNAALSKIALNIINFFDGKEADDLKDYLIDGTELKKNARHPIGLIATVAEAAAAVKSDDKEARAAAERAVRRFWDTPMRTGRRRYYDNCLYFFAILALSGHYVVY
jgi:oligosaccharide reducing-end xylanase